jgi:ribosomal protein S18 acetylase RimI-like enzyme
VYVELRKGAQQDATALIDIIQKKNKERNEKMFKELGLGVPLIAPRTRMQPQPRNTAAARDSQAVSRRGRSQASVASDALASYRLGFDFGFCEALLAFQTVELLDLLAECYGEDKAYLLLTQLCALPRGSGGAAGSSSSSTGNQCRSGSGDDSDERPLSVSVFARVGFQVVGAAIMRFHRAADMVAKRPGQQLLELQVVAVAPSTAGQGVDEALYAYVPRSTNPCLRLLVTLDSNASRETTALCSSRRSDPD